MPPGSVDMNFLFTLGEVTRMVRAWADKEAARYGITRAQWAVLAKLERAEGMKQSELAEQMEMQPITLTRLIDKLCDNGWIERRGDENDRRVNRLYLKKAARYGITRAQWAVLAKVERTEGLKQSELAEQMEMQPITLTRLIDKLCDAGWIERRSDASDRRVNRLYLKKAARPLLGKLGGLRSELTATALEGINPADAHRLLAQLEAIKENVRNAIQNPAGAPLNKEQQIG